MKVWEWVTACLVIILGILVIGGFFTIATNRILKYDMTPKPTIECIDGYQVIITTGKDKMIYHLTDKHDKKIPCR